MRLSKQQIDHIIAALDIYLKNNIAQLYLYGSRINDALKGGDIDLLLLSENENLVAILSEQKHILLQQIKKFIGEQKIDLTIAQKIEVASDSFLQLIFPTAVLLHSWKN